MLSLRSLARALPRAPKLAPSNLVTSSMISSGKTTALAGTSTAIVSRTMASRTDRGRAKRLKKKQQNKLQNAPFNPRRRAAASYRPIDPKPEKVKQPNRFHEELMEGQLMHEELYSKMYPNDELQRDFGTQIAADIRRAREIMSRDLEDPDDDMYYSDADLQLRMADWFTSQPGSTEDHVGYRRALAYSTNTEHERNVLDAEIKRMSEEISFQDLDAPITHLEDSDDETELLGAAGLSQSEARERLVPPTQLAHGDWGEMLVTTDRVRKMWRGGRVESYRSLLVGGNLNGCIGFGVGKAAEPEDAVAIASRMAKRNIFFVERYRNHGLVHDLAGRQNSVIVRLHATEGYIRGNPLCVEILKYAGIAKASCKATGKRNPYNVVRATFKALMTHESLESISRRRGVRLANLAKARRLGI